VQGEAKSGLLTDLRKLMELRWRSRRISIDSSQRPTLVICTASLASPSLLLGRIAPHALICDAGLPEEPVSRRGDAWRHSFLWKSGQITGGLRFAPDFCGILNRPPFSYVVHGCLREGMALSLEGRFEPFPQEGVHHPGAG
jgi:hypothetical protein